MANSESFRFPNRKPWLLGILTILIAVLLYRCHRNRRSTHPAAPSEAIAPAPGQAAAAAPALDPGLKSGQALENGGALVEARARYLEVLKRAPDAASRKEAEAALGRVNILLLTTPRPMPEKKDYIIQRGDVLQRIAARNGTTAELLQKGNGIVEANRIRPGDGLKIFTGKFSIAVSKRRNDLVLFMNGEFFKRYPVGTGKFGRTPVGTFVITAKEKEPTWHPQGRPPVPYGNPENILGTRWMTIEATGDTPKAQGYGIHGTTLDESIGKAESAGCIRMKNADVEEVFMLVPVNTAVTITE